MFNKLSLGQDNFIDDDLLFGNDNFIELDDEDNFNKISSEICINSLDDIEPLDDDEFYTLLKELGTPSSLLDIASSEGVIPLSIKEEERFNVYKKETLAKLEEEKINLEKEKNVFYKEKEEFLKMKDESLERFRIEKEEFENKMNSENEKMYLETKELVTNFLKELKRIYDVSE